MPVIMIGDWKDLPGPITRMRGYERGPYYCVCTDTEALDEKSADNIQHMVDKARLLGVFVESFAGTTRIMWGMQCDNTQHTLYVEELFVEILLSYKSNPDSTLYHIITN